MYGIYIGDELIAKFTVPLTVKSNQPIFVTDALNLKRQVTRRAAQRWEISANLEPLSYGANDLFALFAEKGHSETIDVRIPQNYGSRLERATQTHTPSVSVGAVNATALTISNNSFKIPKGTFVKFKTAVGTTPPLGHSKIYVTTSELTAGSGTLNIFPPLRTSAQGTLLTMDNIVMPCYIDTDTVAGMTYQDGILMDLGVIKLVEAI